LPEEESWEERVVFDVIWMRSKGWGVNTKLVDSSDRDDDMQTYVINVALHAMIRASKHNKRRMFTRIQASDAEPGVIVPDSPLPETWNDQQQAVLDAAGLGDNSDDIDEEDDNEQS
jgi:hypothetical protein